MVNTKKVIHMLWKDKCTITEFRPYTRDNKSTGHEEVVVYKNIPCKLSFDTLGKVNQTEAAAVLVQKSQAFKNAIKLFIGNDIMMNPGSRITVKRSNRVFEFKQSGMAAVFSIHQEILMMSFEDYA